MCSYLLYDILHNFYNFTIIFMITLWSFYHVSFIYTKNFNPFSLAFSGSSSTFLLIPSLISELLLPVLNFSGDTQIFQN